MAQQSSFRDAEAFHNKEVNLLSVELLLAVALIKILDRAICTREADLNLHVPRTI